MENKFIDIGVKLYTKELCKHGMILGSSGSGKSTSLLSIIEGIYHLDDLPNIQIVFDVKGDLTKIRGNYKETNIFLYELNKNWNPDFNGGTPIKMKLGFLPLDVFMQLLQIELVQSNILHTLLKIIDWGDILNPTELLHYLDVCKDEMYNHIEINQRSYAALINKIIGFNIKYSEYFYDIDKKDNYVSCIDNLQVCKDEMIKNNENAIIIINVNSIINDKLLYQLFSVYVKSQIEKTYKKETNNLQCSLYIDEAHLLFNDSLDYMKKHFETFTKMMRSKGVSCWFISQGFTDIPPDISDNCNTLIQHRLKINGGEGKSVSYIAKTFRLINSSMGIKKSVDDYSGQILSLEAGQAFISTTDHNTKTLPIKIVEIDPPYCINNQVLDNNFIYNTIPLIEYNG